MDQFGRESLTARVTRLLGSAIVSGGFRPGDVLPNEAQLGEQFDVGRSAVREAVKILSAKGLIDARPRRGTVVQPIGNWNFLDTEILLWALDATVDRRFLIELTDMRLAFEPSAAALAAISAEPAERDRIERALQAMALAQDGVGDPIRADLEFHKAIIAASHNRFMRPLAALIGTALQLSFRVTNAATGRTGGDVAAHERVWIAIRDGEADMARQAMTDLLDEAGEVIRANAASKEDPAPERAVSIG